MTSPSPPPDSAAKDAVPPPRHGFWFWTFQVVPPLLLLGSLAITNGALFAISLAPALVFAMYSVLMLFLRLLFLLFRRGDFLRLARPLLTIGIFLGLVYYTSGSIDGARAIAGVEAERIQAECDRAGACPDALAIGSGKDGSQRTIVAPSTRLRWQLSYHRGETGFELRLHEALDSSRSWTGGPGATLQLARIDDGRSAPLRVDAAR